MSENKLNDIIGTSLEKIRALVDGETVIGNPIATPNGTTIIPVSKVSMGFASGGIDYTGKKAATQGVQNFGGGGGTGITVTPISFLIVQPDGNVQLMPITGPAQSDTVDKVTSFIERSPELLEKFKQVFTSEKKKVKKTAKKEVEVSADEAAVTTEEVKTTETAE